MIKFILAVGIGSMIGGICRFLLTSYVEEKFLSQFPYGTFAVNVLGCLLIGFVFGIFERSAIDPAWKFFFITGVLGGFTTFSAFSNETVLLLRNGQALTAVTYVLVSVITGLLATFAGIFSSRLF